MIDDSALVDWLGVNVMGWVRGRQDSFGHHYWYDSGGERVAWSGTAGTGSSWQPLARMSDAWLLVEEMRRQGWRFSLYAVGPDASPFWECWRRRAAWGDIVVGKSNLLPDARAICEAVYQATAKEAGDG